MTPEELVELVAQFEIWGEKITDDERWEELKETTNVLHWTDDDERLLRFDGYEEGAVEQYEWIVQKARDIMNGGTK